MLRQLIKSKNLVRPFSLLKEQSQAFRVQPDRTKFKYSRQLPDFHGALPGDELKAQITITDQMMKEKHPLEYLSANQRATNDPYLRLNENSLLLTNFGKEVSEQFVFDMITQACPKVEITRLDLYQTVEGSVAYAVVDFEDQSMMKQARRVMRKQWIDTKLVKVKTLADKEAETHQDRTLVLQDIPKNMMSKELLDTFRQFGSIINYELPVQDQMIKKGLDTYNRSDFGKLKQAEREVEMKLAQKLEKDSVYQEYLGQETEKSFEEFIQENYGEDHSKRILEQTRKVNFNVLESERYQSFVRTMRQLSSEAQTIEQGRANVQEILSKAGKEVDTAQIEKAVNYLKSNSDGLMQGQISQLNQFDAIQNLQDLMKDEITRSFDFLQVVLDQRKDQVKKRLEEAVVSYGPDEAIVQEKKDWSKEYENMPELFKIYDSGMNYVEEYLTINEQIQGVHDIRNVSAGDKLYRLIQNDGAWEQPRNFSAGTMAHSAAESQDRVMIFPEHDEDMSSLRLKGLGNVPQPYREQALRRIQQHAESIRKQQEPSYDVLYHNERKLIKDIVMLEKKLVAAKERQLNPSTHKFDVQELQQFLSDNSQLTGDYGSDLYSHILGKKSTRPKNVNRQEYEIGKQQKLMNNQSNMGYAMITFSHADEVRQAILRNGGSVVVDGSEIKMSRMKDEDHSTLDKAYHGKKMRNDGEIADLQDELVASKAKLRQFELNLISTLPKKERLEKFKEYARHIYEDRSDTSSVRRSKREQMEFEKKIKQQGVGNLLLNDDEKDRKLKHKRAFDVFKKYEFLKAGILTDEQKQQEKVLDDLGLSKPGDLFEPFDFPGVRSSVAAMFTDKLESRQLIRGKGISKPGRRLSYNQHDILEAYLGKDFADPLYIEDDKAFTHENYHRMEPFGYQEKLKDMFPDPTEYLKVPKTLEKQKRFDDYYKHKVVDGKYGDPILGELIEKEAVTQDDLIPHAERIDEQGNLKTYKGELQEKFEEYEQKLIKAGLEPDEWFQKDVERIANEVNLKYVQPELRMNYNQYQDFITQQETEALEQSEISLEQHVETAKAAAKEKIMASLQRHAEYHKKHSNEDLDAIADEMIDEMFQIEKEVAAEEDDAIDPSKEFESGSMFDPTQGDGEASGDHVRRFNEALYNIKELEKTEQVFEQNPMLPQEAIHKLAQQMTDLRRKEFKELQDSEFNKPAHLRTPYYLDKQGRLTAYSKEAIERNNKAMRLVLPEDAPSADAVELTQAQQKAYNEEQAHPYFRQFDGSPGSMPAPLPNVLLKEPESAIPAVTVTDVLQTFGLHSFNIEGLNADFGRMNLHHLAQQDEIDLAKHQFRKNNYGGKSLEQFIEGDVAQEIDVEVQTSRQKVINSELEKLYGQAKELDKKPQTLEEYFEKERNDLNSMSAAKEEALRELEYAKQDLKDKQARKRQLEARLHAGTMSTSQFVEFKELIDDMDVITKQNFLKEKEEEAKLEAVDDIRNIEEMLESHRREMVLQGSWAEEDSVELLRKSIQEIEQNFTDKQLEQAYKNIRQQEINTYKMRNTQSLQEREYYFDEGLGQSLNEHTAELKERFPDVRVFTKRDRDGYAIVKLSYKKDYKYKLDELEKMDPEHQIEDQRAIQESLVKIFAPSDKNSADFVRAVDLMSSSQEPYGFGDLLQKYEQVLQARVDGQMDHEEFEKQLQTIKMRCKSKGLEPVVPISVTWDGQRKLRNDQFDQMLAQQDLFDREIHEQLELRKREKLLFTKYDEEDVVRPGMSNEKLYQRQVSTLQETIKRLEKDSKWLANERGLEGVIPDSDQFNKKRFDEMKTEIKRRKEAKERLLQQGFADFKSYTI